MGGRTPKNNYTEVCKMNFCKKIAAVLIAAAMILGVVPAAAQVEMPEVPEGYDGYVTLSVEALTMGWGFIVEPTLVPYHEGESIAQVAVRTFEEKGIEYVAGGTPEENFYLQGVACPQLAAGAEPNVPEYLMAEINDSEMWTGEENGNGILDELEFTDLAGWLFADSDISIPDYASAIAVEEGHVYRCMFSIYGYGMDVWGGDGWGMFPPFENNPVEGVSRDELYKLYANIMADEEMMALVGEGGAANEAFAEFANTLSYLGSSQEELDDAASVLIVAIEEAQQEPEPTDEPVPTDEPEPTEEPEPEDPGVPETGAASLAGIGIAALLSAAGIVLFRKKSR